MSQKQAERLYQYLQTHRSAQTREHVCEQLNISVSTFKRALTLLREQMGITVYSPMNGGYRIDARDKNLVHINNHWLSPEELTHLIQGYQLFNALSKNSHLAHLMQPVLQKMAQIVDLDPNKDTSYFEIISPHERINNGNHLPILIQALQNHQQVQIRYEARSTSASKRSISPQKLIRYRENWYVLAYCHTRSALRTFACERIQDIQISPHALHKVPPETIRQFLGAVYGIFGGPKQFTAKITFLSSIAPWIQDEIWHPDQNIQQNSDGSIQLSIPIGNNLYEITMDLLRYAKHIKNIEPEALKQQYLSDLNQSLQQINTNPTQATIATSPQQGSKSGP